MAGDVAANPLHKDGYRLEFHDEFASATLDTDKWLPYYLPHWSSRAASAPRYRLDDSHLVLEITADQRPWCPEFNGEVIVSSLQTGLFAGPVGSPDGQHRFNPACVVREAQQNCQLYTPQYGYFEARAKGNISARNVAALWMIGYEDTPEKSGEIAIFEIFGKHLTPTASLIGYGIHPWGDPTLHDEFFREEFAIDATQYHLYAVEWTPTHVDFYVDNVKQRTIQQSPQYPLQLMLNIYELPVAVPSVETYPKEFMLDYVRVYQPVGGY
jgi:hypothetical protein